jgi:H+/Cl- antiporter ClcA
MAIGLLTLIFVIFSVGSVSALFLFLITQSQSFFLLHPQSVWFLPLVGLLTGWIYTRWGSKWPSTPHILQQAHTESSSLHWMMALMIFIFTVLSQLCGASTGRESTAVQFGASLSEGIRDLVLSWTKKLALSRETLVRCGLAAGFAAVFGVPFAGTLFAVEATPGRRWPWKQLPLVCIAAFGAHSVSMAWGATHKNYPTLAALPWNWVLFLQWACLGLAFGLMAKFFLLSLYAVEKSFHGLSNFLSLSTFGGGWLRPALGGLMIAGLTQFVFHNTLYNGLGLPLIQLSLDGKMQTLDFLWKTFSTVLSTGSGLKGGEVTPLMAIGASLGGTLAGVLSLPAAYTASLGLVSVFASSAHIPWTGAVMAWEFFGFEAFLPTFVICWIARHFVGRHGLFRLLHK